MKKNTTLIEETMNNSYRLFETLRDSGADPALASSALTTAKDIHEIKKEYLLIMRGISEALEQELEDLNHRLDTLKEEQQQNALLKQQYEGQVQVLEEQISSGKQNSEHYQNRLTALGEDLDRRTQEKEKLAEDKLELQSRLKEIRASLSKETEALENIVSNVEECTQAVEDGKNEIIEILNSRATTKGKVQRFDAMLEQLNIRKAEISQRILRLKSEEEVLEKERLNAQKQYDAVTAVIHSTNEECVRLDGEVQKLQDELKKQNSQMEIGQTAYHREASRLESLKNITERYDGYGNSIRRVMEQKNREPGIKGVVADIIHVQKDYEVAIETALGGSIQNIVTDNEQTAKRMIGFLKKNRFGRATFLPLSNISGRGGLNQRDVLSEPGVVGTANTLVNADKEYSELVMYLLGRVLVVDNIDYAIAIGKKYRHSLRMVTIEGESLSPGGSMTGGAFKNNSNLLGRRREIEELERSVGILRKELEETQKSIGENRSRRNVLRDTIADFQQKLRQQYVEQNTAKMNLEQLKEKEGRLPDAATIFSSSVRIRFSSSSARVWLNPSFSSILERRVLSSFQSFAASATRSPHWLLYPSRAAVRASNPAFASHTTDSASSFNASMRLILIPIIFASDRNPYLELVTKSFSFVPTAITTSASLVTILAANVPQIPAQPRYISYSQSISPFPAWVSHTGIPYLTLIS